MSSACLLRKLRGHYWFLGEVWMILDIFYHLLLSKCGCIPKGSLKCKVNPSKVPKLSYWPPIGQLIWIPFSYWSEYQDDSSWFLSGTNHYLSWPISRLCSHPQKIIEFRLTMTEIWAKVLSHPEDPRPLWILFIWIVDCLNLWFLKSPYTGRQPISKSYNRFKF